MLISPEEVLCELTLHLRSLINNGRDILRTLFLREVANGFGIMAYNCMELLISISNRNRNQSLN